MTRLLTYKIYCKTLLPLVKFCHDEKAATYTRTLLSPSFTPSPPPFAGLCVPQRLVALNVEVHSLQEEACEQVQACHRQH